MSRPASAKLRRIGTRLLRSIVVVLGIASFNFGLVHLAPGDVADVLAGESGSATPEYMDTIRQRFGLDQPLIVQFGTYLWRILQLDLGFSFRHSKPVADLIFERLPATLLLMLPTLILAFLVGAALGAVASRRVRTVADAVISVGALVFYATPIFWIGLMMIVLFSVRLGWLPSSGMETVGAGYTGLAYVGDVARHMVMPVIAMSLFYVAFYTRMMRASMLEVSTLDFVTTARAKGLSEEKIAYKHVLANALLPMVTVLGLQVATLLGGSVLIETVFGWPGLGRLAFESVTSRDVNLLLGVLLLCSVLVVLTNIGVDLVYAWLDPRIADR